MSQVLHRKALMQTCLNIVDCACLTVVKQACVMNA